MGQVSPSGERAENLKNNFDVHCKEAAEAIASADYFMLATGAGFSADSGLAGKLLNCHLLNCAVYKDIADVAAYRQRDLTYADLCVPDW